MNLGFGFEVVAHWHSIPVREYIHVDDVTEASASA